MRAKVANQAISQLTYTPWSLTTHIYTHTRAHTAGTGFTTYNRGQLVPLVRWLLNNQTFYNQKTGELKEVMIYKKSDVDVAMTVTVSELVVITLKDITLLRSLLVLVQSQ